MQNKKPTPGPWYHEKSSYGSAGGRGEPPEPGYPPIVYTEVEIDDIVYDVILAEGHEPIYYVEPVSDDEFDDGTRYYEGDANANIQMMAASPVLLKSCLIGLDWLNFAREQYPDLLEYQINGFTIKEAIHEMYEAVEQATKRSDRYVKGSS